MERHATTKEYLLKGRQHPLDAREVHSSHGLARCGHLLHMEYACPSDYVPTRYDMLAQVALFSWLPASSRLRKKEGTRFVVTFPCFNTESLYILLCLGHSKEGERRERIEMEWSGRPSLLYCAPLMVVVGGSWNLA